MLEMTCGNPRLYRFPWHWLDVIGLGEYRWARKWMGGHWERWWVDPCRSFIWLHTDRCSIACNTRPPACFGMPTCEHYALRSSAPPTTPEENK